MIKKLLNEPEAAKYICMSRSYLRQARMDGIRKNKTPGPPFIRVGRSIRYLKDDLDQWIHKNRIQQYNLFS